MHITTNPQRVCFTFYIHTIEQHIYIVHTRFYELKIELGYESSLGQKQQ